MEFASSAYVDQANTLRAPGYGIVNFTVGYAHPSGRYRVFLNARNLADKRYAASSEFLALAGPNEAAFQPGLRRSVFAGAEIRWEAAARSGANRAMVCMYPARDTGCVENTQPAFRRTGLHTTNKVTQTEYRSLLQGCLH